VTVIEQDLSEIAGDRVYFLLYTRVRRNPEAADGFWFMPSIKRLEYFK
jgi:hypothetical protein